MIADLESGNIVTPSAMKLSAWMDIWLNTYLLDIAQTTKDDYASKINFHIKPTLGQFPLNVINNQTIQNWVKSLQQQGSGPKTIRNIYNNLNAALKKAVVLRMIPHNPCEGTVLPKLQQYQAQVYTAADIQQALAVADDLCIYLIILLGAFVGLRRGEMAALRWSDINFAKKTVAINKSRVHTKGMVIQKAPKTKAGKRTIAIGQDAADALRDAKDLYDNAVQYTPGFKDMGFVLFKKDGQPFHPDSLTQRWERFIAKHNLPPIRLHDLRHSNATALIAAGVSPKVVQHRLGHANVGITLNTYTHVLPSMDEDAAEKLDNALFSTAQPINHPPLIF